MTSFVFSISVLCLAAINNEQLTIAPHELLSAKFQEQFSGNFERIRRILLQESRYQRSILRKMTEQPFRLVQASRPEKVKPLESLPPTHSLPGLLVLSSRPIRAPSA